jgi:hypothetical protein
MQSQRAKYKIKVFSDMSFHIRIFSDVFSVFFILICLHLTMFLVIFAYFISHSAINIIMICNWILSKCSIWAMNYKIAIDEVSKK